ncbi:MAG: helix-hairpin-helix domain-containing protein [Candidatus Heimdallarchaeaceae archaeon]
MFGSYMKGLEKIEDLMNKGDLENAMFELNNLEKGIELNEDEKLACMLLNSHILNKNGNFDKGFMLSKVAFRKSMELNSPLLVVDSTITFIEAVEGLGMLIESSAKEKKEFLQMVRKSEDILKTIKKIKKAERDLRTSKLTELKEILSPAKAKMPVKVAMKVEKTSTPVSKVKGVGQKAQSLIEAGIKTAEELASTSPNELVKIKGIGTATAPKLIENAKLLLKS